MRFNFLFSMFVFCSLLINCQSQNINKVNKVNKEINEKIPEYFLGNWVYVEQLYLDENIEVKNPLHHCMKKYSWNFQKERGNYYLTKNYSTGLDCTIKSSSGKIPIVIQSGSISYLDGDLMRSEKYVIISYNKFSINYKDILKGKVRQIIDIYEKQ